MTWEQIVFLALIQGITEFLPISSSAHLILPHAILGWPDQGPLIDVAIHVGSLFAVIIYFRSDVRHMLGALPQLARGQRTADTRFLLMLIVASIPTLAAGGLMVAFGLVSLVRSAEVIAWATLAFGVLLYAGDRAGLTIRRLEHIGWPDAILIGIAQTLSLVPGTSRSGITITMARFLGFERQEAARFSMLLSIPTILAAGALAALEIYRMGETALRTDAVLSLILSFIAAFAAIWAFMRLLERMTLLPFVIYRLVLSGALFAWLYS